MVRVWQVEVRQGPIEVVPRATGPCRKVATPPAAPLRLKPRYCPSRRLPACLGQFTQRASRTESAGELDARPDPPARWAAVMVVVDVIPPREGASLRCAVAPADLDEGDAPHVDHFRATGAPTAT